MLLTANSQNELSQLPKSLPINYELSVSSLSKVFWEGQIFFSKQQISKN